MRRFVLLIMIMTLVPLSALKAETADEFDPSGFWTGAILKDGSVLPVEIQIDATQGGYQATSRFPDWYFYFPSRPETVRLTPDGLVIEDLLAGDAVMELEPRFEQLIGAVGDDGRRIHLKRSPAPPKPLIQSTPTSFRSKDGTLISGTITLPQFGGQTAGIVMVRGRGCVVGLNGKARFFAQYGIAVLTYDKRGAGKSEGNCETFTFGQLTDDAIAAHAHLASQSKVDNQRVGFMGESAGAWTIQAATEKLKQNPNASQAAFLVTWIGPSTSIIQQQISSAATYGESIGLSKERQRLLSEVSQIIADSSLSDDDAFAKLDAIRSLAEAEGWLNEGFGPDDIPRARDEMSNLWLRRFEYDPADFLGSLGSLPYLAVFGAKDPIVPLAENIEALRDAGTDVEIVVLEESGHGYDFDESELELPSGRAFWLFEGPDTGFTTSTLEFLRARGFV
ncbi:MAG: alpha/beta fold hydrolase [Pseudomonadota bacterium]